MSQDNKELLLKDICARLPYGLKYNFYGYDGCDYTMSSVSTISVDDVFPIELVKPYLFPLSSMTKEQKREIFNGTPLEIDEDGDTLVKDVFYAYGQYTYLKSYLNVLERLNKYHFDYRGLIEKGLAIDATGLNIY